MKALFGAIIALVFAVILIAFFLVGSPSQERLRRYDDIRVTHLQQIQDSVIAYWQEKHLLPANLTSLSDAFPGMFIPSDPEDRIQYEYREKTGNTFELCAHFDTDSIDSVGRVAGKMPYPRPYPVAHPGFVVDSWTWEHHIGATCFERTVRIDAFKDIVPPFQAR